jgi:PKD repeat protein
VKSITPIPKPNPDIFAANGCTGQSVTLSDSSHSDKSSLYTWDFGDKTSASIKAVSTKHSYKTAGSYKVVLSIENGGGCTDTQSHVITIMDFPKSSFTASTVCQGKATIFTNASTGTGALVYGWDFGDNTKPSTVQNPTHTYAIAGTYIVKLLVANKNYCLDSSSVSTIVNPSPIINPWTYKKHGYEVTFIPADTTIGNFDWHFGTTTNDSSSKKSPLFIYPSNDATYTVSLTVKNTNGCVATRTDTVSVSKSGISEPGNTFENVTIYPNPFEGSTSISYTLTSNSKVSIGIYDAQGKRVAQLKDGNYPAGNYNETFEAKKYQVEEGVYFLKMYVNDRYFTTKIVNLK